MKNYLDNNIEDSQKGKKIAYVNVKSNNLGEIQRPQNKKLDFDEKCNRAFTGNYWKNGLNSNDTLKHLIKHYLKLGILDLDDIKRIPNLRTSPLIQTILHFH